MIENLTIIGEQINASIPSTNSLFEENNLDQIVAIAETQDKAGTAYIDVNIGSRQPELMEELVKLIQKKVKKPLSIDTPDFKIAQSGLKVYDSSPASGVLPILNSISPLRMELFDLYTIQPFQPILMVSERVENGKSMPNTTAEDTYNTAIDMINYIEKKNYKIPIEHIIVDTGIAPIGSDMEGSLKRVLESIEKLHSDHCLKGIRTSVGLSNFSIMLPSRCADGSPVKNSLESAFLTLAIPLGLNTIIGSMKRNYRILEDDHPALLCLKDILTKSGYDIITRVIEYYS